MSKDHHPAEKQSSLLTHRGPKMPIRIKAWKTTEASRKYGRDRPSGPAAGTVRDTPEYSNMQTPIDTRRRNCSGTLKAQSQRGVMATRNASR